MPPAMRSKALALVLTLCFCVTITTANPVAHQRFRRAGTATPTSTDISASATESSAPTSTSGAFESPSINGDPTSTAVSNSTSATISPTEHFNYTGYNYTLTPDQLPLVPTVTPGFAVGGIILLFSGVLYTLVGIKNKLIHISLSAAYLSSLAVTVLILYVMNPPVSHLVQGAYVTAIILTGVILGGASIIFTEMTEGLGCLFGGFSLSMWLLVLKPGGLLTATSSKSIFIAAFTLVGFATSFSHYTRPYALIGFISFGGATAIIMGIDCFSRAGLKEFWAYLWNLNTNLFPIGATSYPLTRGIKVEIAAIVVIFLAGIISQMKLWKVIKERREQRARERLEDERTKEQNEENVGRRVEHANAEARDQWEAAYGEKDVVRKPRDSGIADVDSHKKGATSTLTLNTKNSDDEVIEMSQMSPAGLVMAKSVDSGQVTVRVAHDPQPVDENGNPIEINNKRLSHLSQRSSGQEEKVWVVGADGEARLERRPSQKSQRHSLRNSRSYASPMVSPPPDVVPLPFRVPDGEVEDDRRSSIAASFADEDAEAFKRHSKRASAGSRLMKKITKRSSMLSAKRMSMGPSTEDLMQVNEGNEIEDDRASSLNATIDGLSDDEDARSVRSSLLHSPNTEMPPHVIEEDVQNAATRNRAHTAEAKLIISETEKFQVRFEDFAAEPLTPRPRSSTTGSKAAADSTPVIAPSPDDEKDKAAPSVTSAVESKASVTKDRLPPQLSRVVMSYRTNEWAKHLSTADAPELDELKLAEYPAAPPPETKSPLPASPAEKAAPVNIEELQQTQHNAIPPPAPRTLSNASNYPTTANVTRSNSVMSTSNALSRSETATSFNPPERTPSQTSFINPVSRKSSVILSASRSVSTPQPIVESPIEDSFTSVIPAPGQRNTMSRLPPSTHQNTFGTSSNLISKRNTMLKNKTLNITPVTNSTPEFTTTYTASPLQSMQASRVGSEQGSVYNYAGSATGNGNLALEEEDDNMSLSARRNLIRQSSQRSTSSPFPTHPPPKPTPTPSPYTPSPSPLIFDSHQPQRQSSAPSPQIREAQLASWRASVQQDLQNANVQQTGVEKQRSALWESRRRDEQKKLLGSLVREGREREWEERMRRGDMLDAHREALRRMQGAVGSL